ncbi:Na+/H+ antiporter NhaC family protein [Fibrobacter sp. UWH4]|uniref:Na+/H+ antiporter NhaC family protein n=1 Tax=Fibrobacter sp. UWH4 TaxID=1896210 RepID=UPI0009241BE7|nr:Na+/H+ antiporter NhaC family protein [Fibrobacter sp. UWH4]SHL69373.1 transporter, NhaC family [Fibrobacter sp. UWH4]
MFLELCTLLLFVAVLVAALAFKVKLVFAMLAGLAFFVGYALVRGHGVRRVLAMCGRGIVTAKGILILFVLLGLLTALWRAGGVIPLMVVHSVQFIHGSGFLLAVFLLNCAMSLLTGTALGTAATVGVVCATAGHALGVSPCWVGGAILAGAYFGNRISPISSMALLTANITNTDIYANVRRMLKTTWLPLLLSCAIYLVVGLCGFANDLSGVAGDSIYASDVAGNFSAEPVRALFAKEFSLSPWCILPAVLMVILSVLRVRSSRVLLLSALAALPLAFVIENHSLADVLRAVVFGFHAHTPELAPMINGGGFLSMLNVFWIVVIAGCYAGIFKETGMLTPLKSAVEKIAARTNSFCATLVASCVTACVVCNQTLTIILTHQLTENLDTDSAPGTTKLCDADKSSDKPNAIVKNESHALDLYDTAVTVIALVPWSVATAMVLAAANAPASSVLCACFLYLLPICRLV